MTRCGTDSNPAHPRQQAGTLSFTLKQRVNNVYLTYPTTFRMSSKGAYGIGDVCLEPLRDVWSNSQVRINNKLDHSFDPLPSKQGKPG